MRTDSLDSLDDQVSIPDQGRDSSSDHKSKPALGLIQYPIQHIQGNSSPRVKGPEVNAGNSLPYKIPVALPPLLNASPRRGTF
jgi:hypothetical protein